MPGHTYWRFIKVVGITGVSRFFLLVRECRMASPSTFTYTDLHAKPRKTRLHGNMHERAHLKLSRHGKVLPTSVEAFIEV